MSHNEVLELYRQFPYLVPNNSYCRWEGIIENKGVSHSFLFIVPNYPSVNGLIIHSSNDVKLLISSIDKEIKKAATFLEVLSLIKSSLKDVKSQASSDLLNLKSLQSWENVIRDIELYIGNENVDSFNAEVKWVRLNHEDSTGFVHSVRVQFGVNYPRVPLTLMEADLPDQVISVLKKCLSVGEFYNKFKSCVESLLPFWVMCDQLAVDAWVIEPTEPRKKDIHRRLLINSSLSLQLVFNPLNASSLPDVKFLGTLGSVTKARELFQRNLQVIGWEEGWSVADNLTRLLNMESLPQKECETTELEEVECIICYETSLPNQPPPAKWCSNPTCSGRFHHSCLLEWLNSVVTSKQAFDHISGPCPHCDEKLLCPTVLN